MNIQINGQDKYIVDTKEMPGNILSCHFKYKIAATDANLRYGGPKIGREEWHKVLSFFRWSYEKTHSETQVRGFIDPVDRVIRFWAFPQEAGTGMHTDELNNEESKKQRAALPNAGSLIYFFTVHHHCSMSAFQSGGDERNEVNQDGLHITIGNIDRPKHDLDARFYMDTTKFTPNLSAFWDIGGDIAAMTPDSTHDSIARHQMCQKIDVEFPEQWKNNLIEIKKKYETRYSGGLGYSGGTGYAGGAWETETLQERIERVANEVLEELEKTIEFNDIRGTLAFLKESLVFDAIMDAAQPERFDALDIRGVIRDMNDLIEDEVTEIVDELAGNGGVDSSAKKRKNRRKRNGQTAAANEKRELNAPPNHGDTRKEGEEIWDDTQKKWVLAKEFTTGQ